MWRFCWPNRPDCLQFAYVCNSHFIFIRPEHQMLYLKKCQEGKCVLCLHPADKFPFNYRVGNLNGGQQINMAVLKRTY
jgi:hypothetical protein